MKILLLDIEVAPNTAYVWGLFNENIPLQRLMESSYVLCWSAKWLGEGTILFDSVEKSSQKLMLRKIHKLLEEADVVIHYNGTRFDIPVLNKEFILYDIPPPAPYRQIDLYNTAKTRFRFVSTKLEYVAKILNISQKKKHRGFELWVDCMKNKKSAWKEMEEYNKQDVKTLEELYIKFLPWIKNHPNHGVYQDNKNVCPHCGESHYHSRGWSYTNAYRFKRYQCLECGSWFKSAHAEKLPKGTKRFNGL